MSVDTLFHQVFGFSPAMHRSNASGTPPAYPQRDKDEQRAIEETLAVIASYWKMFKTAIDSLLGENPGMEEWLRKPHDSQRYQQLSLYGNAGAYARNVAAEERFFALYQNCTMIRRIFLQVIHLATLQNFKLASMEISFYANAWETPVGPCHPALPFLKQKKLLNILKKLNAMERDTLHDITRLLPPPHYRKKRSFR